MLIVTIFRCAHTALCSVELGLAGSVSDSSLEDGELVMLFRGIMGWVGIGQKLVQAQPIRSSGLIFTGLKF